MEEQAHRSCVQWIVLGSSPYAPLRLPKARSDYPNARIITTNAGIELVPNPDAFFMSDHIAFKVHGLKILAAQRAGTRVITDRPERDYDWCDERFLETAQRGIILSGLLSAEWCCTQGATQVIFVGCDGYRHADDYFDLDAGENQRRVDAELLQHCYRFISGVQLKLAKNFMAQNPTNTGHIQQFLPQLFRRWKHVKWTYYGQPLFDLDPAPNLEVIACDP